MKKFLVLSMVYSFLNIFTNSQDATNTTICELSAYGPACHDNNLCAFVESSKDSNRYFACLEVKAKDCNFFCNYFNELNASGGITSKDCVCNGIKYPSIN